MARLVAERTERGMTIIEVTLAIIVGILLILAVVFLYNQVHTSAGNARASEKVQALQALVEELAAGNNGIYPTGSVVYTQWTRRRDDNAASPWGGNAGPGTAPGNTVFQQGFSANDNFTPGIYAANNGGLLLSSQGCLYYALMSPGATGSWQDPNNLNYSSFKNYAVCVYGSNGGYYLYPHGGK